MVTDDADAFGSSHVGVGAILEDSATALEAMGAFMAEAVCIPVTSSWSGGSLFFSQGSRARRST